MIVNLRKEIRLTDCSRYGKKRNPKFANRALENLDFCYIVLFLTFVLFAYIGLMQGQTIRIDIRPGGNVSILPLSFFAFKLFEIQTVYNKNINSIGNENRSF